MRIRHPWLDLARGVAVVSMLVAHTAPVGGVVNVSEYLTAPLFAALVGASLHYAWLAWDAGAARFVAAQELRGAMLFGAGVAIQPVYSQIVSVLQWLGVLTAVLAPLVVVGVRGAAALAGSLLLVASGPPLMTAARGWLAADPTHWAGPAVVFAVAGGPYRLLSMVAAGLLGIVLGQWLSAPNRRLAAVAVAALAASGLAVAIGKLTPLGADPYSGTWAEVVASLVLVVSAAAASAWVADMSKPGWLGPVVATGQMAMSAYALQFVILRALGETVLAGERDDHWWVLAVLILCTVGFCWGWRHWVGIGPLEWLLRLPPRLLRRGGWHGPAAH